MEAVAERGAVRGDVDSDQTPSRSGLLACRTETHQQLLAGELHIGELLEPSPQPFQLAAAHRAFFGNRTGALGKDVELAVLRQQLDLHTRPGVLPGRGDKRLFQPGQAPLWRAD